MDKNGKFNHLWSKHFSQTGSCSICFDINFYILLNNIAKKSKRNFSKVNFYGCARKFIVGGKKC